MFATKQRGAVYKLSLRKLIRKRFLGLTKECFKILRFSLLLGVWFCSEDSVTPLYLLTRWRLKQIADEMLLAEVISLG